MSRHKFVILCLLEFCWVLLPSVSAVCTDNFFLYGYSFPGGSSLAIDPQSSSSYSFSSRYVNITVVPKVDDWFCVRFSGSSSVTVHSWEQTSFTIQSDTTISKVEFMFYTYTYGCRPDYFRDCLSGFTVQVGNKQCSEAEAKPDSMKYVNPSKAANSPTQGTILEDEDLQDSISWVYDNSKTNTDMCPCSTWQAAYSTVRQDVFSDTGRISLSNLRCPSYTSSSVKLSYQDLLTLFPVQTWFWFSAREVVKYGSYSSYYSSPLPSLKLCIRPGLVIAPTMPTSVYFFDDTAYLPVSWDEKTFPTSRCGQKQPVDLWIKHGNDERKQKDINNGYMAELHLSNPMEYSFALQMGSSSTQLKTVVTSFDCTYLKNKFSVQEIESDPVTWELRVSFNWDGGCSNLKDSSLYEVIFDVRNHDGTGRIAALSWSRNYSYSAFPYVFNNIITNQQQKEYGTNYLNAVLTVIVHYSPTNQIIDTYQTEHVFCSVTPPSLSSDEISLVGDAVCEDITDSTEFTLVLPSVTSVGQVCDMPTSIIRSLYENSNKINGYTDEQQWTVTLPCPDGNDMNYSYVLSVSNTYADTSVTTINPIRLCRNTNPAIPYGLDANARGMSNGTIVVTSGRVELSWHLDNWGNCKNYDSLEKEFIIQLSSEQDTTNITVDGDHSSEEVEIAFDGEEVRRSITWSVIAIRDKQYSTMSYSHTFEACKPTNPGAPTPVDVIVDKTNTCSSTFLWDEPTFKGNDCGSDTNELYYFVRLYDSEGTLVFNGANTTELNDVVDVKRLSGCFTWSVTACVKGSNELCNTSTRSSVIIKSSCEGVMTWRLDDGLLTINGSGKMEDFDSNGVPWYNDGSLIERIEVYSDVLSIGKYAFSNCVNVNVVVIGKDVETIGAHCFHGCKNLISVTIPESVKEIDEYAFCSCTSLKNITIPGRVISVSKFTFSGCSSLFSVSIPETLQHIKDNAFENCSRLTKVTIPDSIRTIGDHAFENCNSLTYINFPDSLQSIGSSSFRLCTNLESVFYQGDGTSLTSNVARASFSPFDSCDSLENVCVSPEYKYSTFYDETVTSDTELCELFRSNFNHCFKASYKGYIIQQKRKNATDWEAFSNDCVQNQCDNDIGRVSWSMCNSTSKVIRSCVNNECVEVGSNEDESGESGGLSEFTMVTIVCACAIAVIIAAVIVIVVMVAKNNKHQKEEPKNDNGDGQWTLVELVPPGDCVGPPSVISPNNSVVSETGTVVSSADNVVVAEDGSFIQLFPC